MTRTNSSGRAGLRPIDYPYSKKAMSDNDFDIESLAAYLHLAPAQVSKLADRDKLPGRKVGGHWRFSRAEILKWLEDRIGLSDDAELARMERDIQYDADRDDDVLLTVSEMLPLKGIEVSLGARTRNSVITSMIDVAERTGWLWDPAAMVDAVRSREDLHSTALDNGVAMMHPRRPLPNVLERPFIAFGRTDRALPFSNNRGVLTDVFFLLCSVSDRGHLHALARLSRLVNDSVLLAELRAAPDARAIHEAIQAREESLPE
jgi:PTS system nitrogen regulatory IIA component